MYCINRSLLTLSRPLLAHSVLRKEMNKFYSLFLDWICSNPLLEGDTMLYLPLPPSQLLSAFQFFELFYRLKLLSFILIQVILRRFLLLLRHLHDDWFWWHSARYDSPHSPRSWSWSITIHAGFHRARLLPENDSLYLWQIGRWGFSFISWIGYEKVETSFETNLIERAFTLRTNTVQEQGALRECTPLHG